MNFSSENFDGVHPSVMQALAEVNIGFAPSYGNDPYTLEAIKLFKKEFGDQIEVYFTFNGTGANNFGLSCLAEKHSAIFCSSVAHLYVDETTAPETFIGCRLYPVDCENGKITVKALQKQFKRAGDVHHPQGKIVTLTQPTEYGTVYNINELKAIKSFCVENKLLLHVDGARFFNAVTALNVSLKTLSTDVGIDILTLGGTKIGMMFGEAVIFFNHSISNTFRFTHKRSMQLASKNRFMAAQFKSILTNKLWQKLSTYTNQLAIFFEAEMQMVELVKIAYPVQTNTVFLNMPKWLYIKMQAHAHFYYWDEKKEEARLVFSFSNTKEEIKDFVYWIKKYTQM